jgi:hypothetical protein
VLALDLLGTETTRFLGMGVGEFVPVNYWLDPDFLRQYELRGELITVDPGARLTINPEAIPLVE